MSLTEREAEILGCIKREPSADADANADADAWYSTGC